MVVWLIGQSRSCLQCLIDQREPHYPPFQTLALTSLRGCYKATIRQVWQNLIGQLDEIEEILYLLSRLKVPQALVDQFTRLLQDDVVGFATLTSALLLVILKEKKVEKLYYLTKTHLVPYDYVRPTHDLIYQEGLPHLSIAEPQLSMLLDHFGPKFQ